MYEERVIIETRESTALEMILISVSENGISGDQWGLNSKCGLELGRVVLWYSRPYRPGFCLLEFLV
jgi:hypothetical protein